MSYERIGNAEALAAWFGALAAVGLGVDLASSAELPFTRFGEPEVMPAVVAGPDLPAVDADAFVDWQKRQVSSSQTPKKAFLEEVQFQDLGPHRFVKGWQFDYSDGGSVRLVAVLGHNDAPIAYMSSNLGYRHVQDRRRPGQLPDLLSEIEWLAEEIAESPSVVSTRELEDDAEY